MPNETILLINPVDPSMLKKRLLPREYDQVHTLFLWRTVLLKTDAKRGACNEAQSEAALSSCSLCTPLQAPLFCGQVYHNFT